MTAKEAIDILWRYDVDFEPHPAEEVMHAIDMAIEALSAQTEKRTEKRTETHACDCINRQAAIDEITEYGSGDTIYMSVVELKRRIEALPPAQPEQEWNYCEGCKHRGMWENEVEYGYNSPCTNCTVRVPSNYEPER